jgi:hypothetical protein
MADDPKIALGYKVTVFDIKTGEIIVDMSIDQSAAGSVPDVIRAVIDADRKEKRRLRMKLEP